MPESSVNPGGRILFDIQVYNVHFLVIITMCKRYEIRFFDQQIQPSSTEEEWGNQARCGKEDGLVNRVTVQR